MILLFPLARCFDCPLVGLISYSAQKMAKSEPNKQVIRLMWVLIVRTMIFNDPDIYRDENHDPLIFLLLDVLFGYCFPILFDI